MKRRWTFNEVCDIYMRNHCPQLTSETRRTQIHQIWFWQDRLGGRFIDEITPQEITVIRDEMRITMTYRGDVYSPGTINRYLAKLSGICTFAEKELFALDFNPARKVRRMKEPRGRVRYLTEEERERLFKACKLSQNRELHGGVLFAMATGCRHGEQRALTWADIDLDRRWAIVRDSKNHDSRGVPLVESVVEMLRDKPRTGDQVFGMKSWNSWRSAWMVACRRAKVEDFRWHDLRHCCASYLSMAGVDIRVIATILGHRTLAMSARYSHLNQGTLVQVADEMALSVGL